MKIRDRMKLIAFWTMMVETRKLKLRYNLKTLSSNLDSCAVRMILSKPCFELWLLLHFEFTDRPFHNVPGGKTAAQQVTEHLRRYLPGYEKNDPKTFERCQERMHDAIRNSKRLAEAHDIPDAPRTDVGSLVERLLQVSRNGEA